MSQPGSRPLLHRHGRGPGQRLAREVSAPGPRDPTPSVEGFQFQPFTVADIRQLVLRANEHRIAAATVGAARPYTAEFARRWIASHACNWQTETALHWAVRKIGDERLLGYAGLHGIDRQRRQAELCFWVGSGVQRRRYGTEWSQAVLAYAMSALRLNRVYALQRVGSPGDAHVLQAVDMTPDGYVHGRLHDRGEPQDLACWSILRARWEQPATH